MTVSLILTVAICNVWYCEIEITNTIVCTDISTFRVNIATCDHTFPENFRFGTATSAYQIEGGWNADGKGESIWDYMTHTFPEKIFDHSNGDIACDSYNKYSTDVEMLSYLGVDFYRFSISWPRIMPNGLPNAINQKGIDYYNRLIDALLENGITPVITMYHWDLPQHLQLIGGWVNHKMAHYFADYARVLFENFGDRVKTWITFNEPTLICKHGYGDSMAPSLASSGIAHYQCAHNLLKAHAKVYHLYNEEYRSLQQGKIGIVLESPYYFASGESTLNEEARERTQEFHLGYYAHPIFHTEGNYPQIMIDRIANRSYAEGFRRSRLPAFTSEEVNTIRGTADYLGLNHYSSSNAYYIDEPEIGEPSYTSDLGTSSSTRPNMEADGLRMLLNWIKAQYNSPEIMITENGFSDGGGTNDTDRKNYYQQYLTAVLEALLEDSVNVTAYTAWSLMDNFEWMSGYIAHYGIYSVDFESANRTRTIKISGEYIKQVIATRCVSDEGCSVNTSHLDSLL